MYESNILFALSVLWRTSLEFLEASKWVHEGRCLCRILHPRFEVHIFVERIMAVVVQECLETGLVSYGYLVAISRDALKRISYCKILA
jgi:hypothetical protein